MEQGRCHGQALFVAARKAAGRHMAEAGQIEFFDDRFDALVQPAAAQAVGTAEEAEVLFDGQRRVEGEFLRYVADMGPGLGSGGSQVDAGYGNLAGRYGKQAAEHAERRRFPGSVRAEEAEDFPFVDAERRMIDGDEIAEAADNGKQVSVLVELKARFDEENNILWAKMLEKAGCHVIYGIMGLKTHSKITLVVRREEDGIRRYVHLATGNYNGKTARIYTDVGILTANTLIGVDASAFFNLLSGYSDPPQWNKLAVAPLNLRETIYQEIDQEIAQAKAGKKAVIVAKMNSLLDKYVIAKLYEASAAGVKIRLIVRGICVIRPGLPGISENIEVHSIVGRFLEHSRLFYFYNC